MRKIEFEILGVQGKNVPFLPHKIAHHLSWRATSRLQAFYMSFPAKQILHLSSFNNRKSTIPTVRKHHRQYILHQQTTLFSTVAWMLPSFRLRNILYVEGPFEEKAPFLFFSAIDKGRLDHMLKHLGLNLQTPKIPQITGRGVAG